MLAAEPARAGTREALDLQVTESGQLCNAMDPATIHERELDRAAELAEALIFGRLDDREVSRRDADAGAQGNA